ncbi:MAG: type II toxin-antitoxin system RelE/ParE family toxin [Candidatus Aminicenantia bacterium]
MGSFKVKLKPSAEKDLRKISPDRLEILRREIDKLADNPFPHKCRKLSGTEGLLRHRIGDYRIIYEVNIKKKIVIIYYIRHRKEAYRNV